MEKQHQTLCVLSGDSQQDAYKSRLWRYFESFTQESIKVDWSVLHNGSLYRGTPWTVDPDKEDPMWTLDGDPIKDIRKRAASVGYNLVVFALPGQDVGVDPTPDVGELPPHPEVN